MCSWSASYNVYCDYVFEINTDASGIIIVCSPRDQNFMLSILR